MPTAEPTIESVDSSFTIHVLNSYAGSALSVWADAWPLSPGQIQKIALDSYNSLTRLLDAEGIAYGKLAAALTPRLGRHEVAFLFDSEASGSWSYGSALAHAWLPALRDHGPKTSTVRHGDILALDPRFVWKLLDESMVCSTPFPRLSTEQYFVVYMTNMSPAQLASVDQAIRRKSDAYLGYVDCSVWNPLKTGMLLPQYGLRVNEVFITESDDAGHANLPGYPIEEHGFSAIGIDADTYGMLLTHRLDNGVPDWADSDSALALSVLGGDRRSASDVTISIDQRRLDYLLKDHPTSMASAGFAALDVKSVGSAIEEKIASNLIYNLRYRWGTRDGVRDRENDAVLFSVQVEFPDLKGIARRYHVGLKYHPESHTGEVVTFF